MNPYFPKKTAELNLGGFENLQGLSVFLNHIFQKLKDDQINVSNYELDHICYRVNGFEKYISLKNKLKKKGDMLSEKKINGRPILIIKLYEPIIFRNRKIYLLELPAPKKGSEYIATLFHFRKFIFS